MAIKPCRYPGCTSTYAGEHTWHTLALLDARSSDFVRDATREDIEIAAHYPGALITYQFGDAYSAPRCGYLAKSERDSAGNDVYTALDDDEIAAIARARGIP